MSLTEFQKEWKEIAAKFKLDIELNYLIQTERSSFIAPVLLRKFGAENGMILITDFGSIKSFVSELIKKGYGYSTLSEPTVDEQLDLESIIDMLKDWGWSAPEPPPQWYNENST